MVRVKICGNRRLEDALKAVEYGADAIGFLVGQRHSSPDFISEAAAVGIIEQLPPFISTVLVTHLVVPEEIIPLAQKLGVSTIQLHGETNPRQAETIKNQLPYIKIYKAVHVTGEESVKLARQYSRVVDAVLLDTISVATDQVGGTGRVHDWGISKEIVKQLDIPVILAGGLNPDNVAEAIRQVEPFGVDVNSGTKAADGYKDYDKLRSFIRTAKLEG
ncbi:MAG: phosphoribosylanthranilate isomerase [Candidatus Saccharimonadales bacterium]